MLLFVRGVYSFCVLSLGIAVFISVADAQEAVPDARVIAAQKSSVEILVDGRLSGSGWFADGTGTVVTAAHVLVTGKRFEVLHPEFGRFQASVVAASPGDDLALLKIPPRPEGLYPFLKVADKPPVPGATVYFIGSAVFRHAFIIRGAMARTEPGYEFAKANDCYVRVLFIAAPTPPGTSGGCWLSSQGEVVGNQSGYLNNSKGVAAGIAMACLPDAISRLLRERTHQPCATLQAGLEELWSQPSGFLTRFPKGLSGIATVPILNNGVVHKAGFTHETVITGINDKMVSYRSQLLNEIRLQKPGDKIKLHFYQPDVFAEETKILELADVFKTFKWKPDSQASAPE